MKEMCKKSLTWNFAFCSSALKLGTFLIFPIWQICMYYASFKKIWKNNNTVKGMIPRDQFTKRVRWVDCLCLSYIFGWDIKSKISIYIFYRQNNINIITTAVQLAVEEIAIFGYISYFTNVRRGVSSNIPSWVTYASMEILYYVVLPAFFIFPISNLFIKK